MLMISSGCSAVPARKSPKVIENSIGMKLALVPAGDFEMGSEEPAETLAIAYPQYELSRFLALRDEAPVHNVRITRPFYLQQYEVTVDQFMQFLKASGYTPESVADGTGGYGYNARYVAEKSELGDAFEGRDPKYSWRNPGFKQEGHHPVVNVTWNDAVAMSRWLSDKEGRRYRLPTEAEWEYAARAGTQTRYHSSNDPRSLLKIANTFDADARVNWPQWTAYSIAGHDGFAFTAPVGSYTPNRLGLYDMHGNVWEWCSDWYDENYYAKSPRDDPPGPTSGIVRVRRGGSWHTWSLYARSSYRNWNTQETRYPLVGFRLLLEID
ncbi:Formylglycine-generating enzyme, required for sulfatase activity, contains SUMF1/FGE domain [Nitrosovibrio sp. Nv6]|nr:Formylglycine-generating enzyme, required for sulfatase activity, contains SUMF1/FGE domain [Nitrosovibrio sp. Nv6]